MIVSEDTLMTTKSSLFYVASYKYKRDETKTKRTSRGHYIH